jgi:hypothetical protein
MLLGGYKLILSRRFKYITPCNHKFIVLRKYKYIMLIRIISFLFSTTYNEYQLVDIQFAVSVPTSAEFSADNVGHSFKLNHPT